MWFRSAGVALVLVVLVACASEDTGPSLASGAGGSAGESGFAGASGTAGTQSYAGSAGFAGVDGLGGAAGASAMAGSAGNGGNSASMNVGGASGTGGASGDGNDSFETAQMLNIESDAVAASIDSEATDKDYYSFQSNKGDWVILEVTIPAGVNWQDSQYLDPVMTLFNSSGQQIAFNDDALPRNSLGPRLITRVPESDTYYILVQSYCAANGPPCAGSVFNDYSLLVSLLPASGVTPIGVFENEPNDVEMEAQPIDAFVVEPPKIYRRSALSDFSAQSDVDTYLFHVPPADYGGDFVMLSLTFQPEGLDGNGSTARVGNVRIWSALESRDNPYSQANVQELLSDSEVSFVGAQLFVSTAVDSSTWIEVTREPGSSSNDFYTVTAGTWFYFEEEGEALGTHTNDSLAQAHSLIAPQQVIDAGVGYRFAGLLPQGDVDYVQVALPPDSTSVQVLCHSTYRGSAIRGFSVSAFDQNETMLTPSTQSNTSFGFQIEYTGAQVPTEHMTLRISASEPPEEWLPWYACEVTVRP